MPLRSPCLARALAYGPSTRTGRPLVQTRFGVAGIARRKDQPYLHKAYSISAPVSRDAHAFGAQDKLFQLSTQLSQIPMKGDVEMQFTQFDASGATSTNSITKTNIASLFGLSARDLRVLDLPSIGFPHILVRESTILVHMCDLRLLVQADKVLLFRINGIENDVISRVFIRSLQERFSRSQLKGQAAHGAFELRVLEVALASVASTLEAEYLLVKDDVSKALQEIDVHMADKEEAVIHSALANFLVLVRRLASIEQRARLVRNAAKEILDEDEDMADMYLSDKQRGQRHLAHQHQEVEYLFEAYFKANDAVVQEAAGMKENIDKTGDTIKSILDVRRNQIMLLETKVEIAMLSLASATLVAGWYGMNTINYFEDSTWAFGVLVSLSVLGSGLIWRQVIRKLRLIQTRNSKIT
ncbi:hypothetical protein QQS21_003816 [Conoideocrella luteorostrata]|uniref:Magnesium transporter n=1 Tax=Conoideocrella luteorostrata TaxID=1105319 RepID=A0AAJ0CVJ5_9HYPO|nr:hypothetical protein QQS21_003816 [Conoideocrella luteorostrata]